MQGFNHIAGGIAFTGIFASFSEINIFQETTYLGATALFSILPDADHTRSLIGKSVAPLANWVNKKFGHRTITHSLVFYISIIVITSGIERIFHSSNVYTIICTFATASHLIFDMCTKQGIQLFYPFSKRAAVLPGNPNMRLATNDLRSEAIIFVIFCSMVFFCQPLFANGFWTSYNKAFLTHEHVTREFLKSKDLLFVKFKAKDAKLDSGYLIKSSEGKMLFYRQDFTEIPTAGTEIEDFRHTGNFLKFEQKRIYQAEPDSVRIYFEMPLIRVQIQSQNAKVNWYDGALLKSGNEVVKEYTKGFDFFLEEPEQDETKQQRVEMLKGQIKEKQIQISEHKSKIREVESMIDYSNIHLEHPKTSDYKKTIEIQKQRKWREELGQLQDLNLPSWESEKLEIIELQRQLNKTATISANIIILKIQSDDTKRSNRKKDTETGVSNYARR
jgi:inner membrane protein